MTERYTSLPYRQLDTLHYLTDTQLLCFLEISLLPFQHFLIHYTSLHTTLLDILHFYLAHTSWYTTTFPRHNFFGSNTPLTTQTTILLPVYIQYYDPWKHKKENFLYEIHTFKHQKLLINTVLYIYIYSQCIQISMV